MFFSVVLLAWAIGVVSSQLAVQRKTVAVSASGITYFTSPNYPQNYQKDTLVTYDVIGPSGFGILFNIVDFELCGRFLCGYGCFHDYVNFTETINGQQFSLNGQEHSMASGFCDSLKGPLRIASQSNCVTVNFKTGYSGPSYRGFNLSATALAPVNKHISVPTNGKVYITSPNYPVADYFLQRNTVYYVESPQGSAIEFDAVDFELYYVDGFDNNNNGWRFAYVSFGELNGIGISATVTAFGNAFYGTNGPRKLRSSSNLVMIVFRTNDYRSHRGFNISAQLVPKRSVSNF